MAKRKTASKPLPPQEHLNRLLRYDPETGKLFWKVRTPDLFSEGRHTAAHTCAKWNATFAGKEAFTAQHPAGYRHSNILGRGLLAHRVIWKMVTGDDANEVDHIDGVRSNNRWSNLRNVTTGDNRKNAARAIDNASGATGVRWSSSCSKWQAFITVDYRPIMLGTFDNFDDAVAARKAAERKHQFHENHGRNAVNQKEP